MRLLSQKLILVVLAIAIGFAPVHGNAMSEFGKKRAISICTALLAVGTVGMAGVANYTGQLQERGFNSRVIGSNRRAIVAFLAKALGLRSDDGGEYRFESRVEAEGFDPESFKDWSAEDLDAATVITSESDGQALGFIIHEGGRMYFKMSRTLTGRFKFTAMTAAQR